METVSNELMDTCRKAGPERSIGLRAIGGVGQIGDRRIQQIGAQGERQGLRASA